MTSNELPMPRPVPILLDTNVVLDWVLDRQPWADQALPIWQARDNGIITTHIAASAMTDIFYIARHQLKSIPLAMQGIDKCLAVLNFLPVDKSTLQRARALPGTDFEDNVILACAEAARIPIIITRNVKDFQHPYIRIMEPAAFARIFNPDRPR